MRGAGATQRLWHVRYSACSVPTNAAPNPTGLKTDPAGERGEGERAEEMRSGCISLCLLSWALGEKGPCFICCEENPFPLGLLHTHQDPEGRGAEDGCRQMGSVALPHFQAGCRWQHGRNPQLALERVQEAQSLQAALEGEPREKVQEEWTDRAMEAGRSPGSEQETCKQEPSELNPGGGWPRVSL